MYQSVCQLEFKYIVQCTLRVEIVEIVKNKV